MQKNQYVQVWHSVSLSFLLKSKIVTKVANDSPADQKGDEQQQADDVGARTVLDRPTGGVMS